MIIPEFSTLCHKDFSHPPNKYDQPANRYAII